MDQVYSQLNNYSSVYESVIQSIGNQLRKNDFNQKRKKKQKQTNKPIDNEEKERTTLKIAP